MSTSDRPDDLATHYSSAPSMLDSIFSNPESPSSRGTGFSVDRYITNYDRLEAFSCGISPTDSLRASLEASRSRMQALRNYSSAESNEELQGSSGLSYGIENQRDTVTWVNKDDQVNEMLSSLEQDLDISVYGARIRLPSGENATWDINDGEERTQPRRGSRAPDGRRRTQASLPRSSSSVNGNRNSVENESSISMRDSQNYSQVLHPSQRETTIEQADERNESASHPFRFLASSPGMFFRADPSPNRQGMSSITNLQGDGTHQYFDGNPSQLEISVTASTERSGPLGTSLYGESQTRAISTQQPGTGPPDITFTQRGETNFNGFLPANNFLRNTRNAECFQSPDSRGDSIGYFASPSRSPISPSNVPGLSHGSSVSRGADSAPRLVDENALAPHTDEPLVSRKEKEQDDDYLDWFQRCINNDMLEPGDEWPSQL